MRKILFIGGLGTAHEFGGELTKNKLLTRKLREFVDKLIIVDTYRSRSKPWRLWRLPFVLLMNPNTPIILSTSYGNVYWLHRILRVVFPKRKIILWVIGGDLHLEVERERYRVDVLKSLHYLVVEGQIMKDALYKQGLVNVKIIPNFKDASLLPSWNTHIPYTVSSALRLVFFSRIMPEKGCDLILDLAQKLNERGYENKFIIDFYGPIVSEYSKKFRAMLEKLPNVYYKGTLDLLSGAGYITLSSYHLNLFPSFWSGEGFPGVIVDSFISGLPILASDWGLNKELVDQETGFIIPAHDGTQMLSIVSNIINGRIALEPLAQKARQRAMCYDVNEVITSDLIVEILK